MCLCMSVCVQVCVCACVREGGGHSKVKGSWALKKKCPSMWYSRASLSLSAGKRSLQIGHSFHGGVAGPPVLASDKGPPAKPLKRDRGERRGSVCSIAFLTCRPQGEGPIRLGSRIPVPKAAAWWFSPSLSHSIFRPTILVVLVYPATRASMPSFFSP